VVSVTSEAASVSFQAPRPQTGRSDGPAQHDQFVALVDSNIAADTGNEGLSSIIQRPPGSQRVANDAGPTADDVRSRQAEPNTYVNSGREDREPPASERSDADSAEAKTTPAERPRAKSAGSKDGTKEPTDPASTGAKPANDGGDAAQPAEASSAVPNAIAVPIPVAAAIVNVIASSTAAVNAINGSAAPLAAAPLAIAAAAIAATAPDAAAAVTPTAQTDTAGDAAGAAATTPAGADATPQVFATAGDSEATPPQLAAAAATTGKPSKQSEAETAVVASSEGPISTAVKTTEVAPTAAPVAPQLAATPNVAAPGTSSTKSDKAETPKDAVLAGDAQPNASQPSVITHDGGHELASVKPQGAANASPFADATPPVHDRSLAPAHAQLDPAQPASQPSPALPNQLTAAQVATAPVPTLSVTAATNAPVPLSALAVEIAASARSGKSHFEIRLDPADLGRIDVRIDVDRNGQMTSHLRVEKPETLSMLRQDAPQLQRALDDAGFKTGDGGLQFSLRDQSFSGRNNGDESTRNAQRLVISDEDTIPAVVAGRSYGRMLGSSSGVDIRV
jgi:flagellar hook-length control protein FliK